MKTTPFIYPFKKFDEGIIRPWVPVIIENTVTKVKTRVELALLDTGADYCCFPKRTVSGTGSDLKNGVKDKMNGLGGESDVWKHKFRIHLLHPNMKTVIFKSKEIDVRCVENQKLPPILGIMDFMLNLNIRFHFGSKKVLIYTP